MLKIRLRRMGAIRQPHYRIVVADSRAPRDGRFFEILGHYNPRTDPPTIQVDIAKYEEWKSKGAQPTEAVVKVVRQFNSGKVADVTQPAARRTHTARRTAAPAPAPAEEATTPAPAPAAAAAPAPAPAAPAEEAAAPAAVEPAADTEGAEVTASALDEETTPEPTLEAASNPPEGAAEGETDTDTAS